MCLVKQKVPGPVQLMKNLSNTSENIYDNVSNHQASGQRVIHNKERVENYVGLPAR